MVLIVFLCVLKRCEVGWGSPSLVLGPPCFFSRVGRFPVFLLRLCAVSGGLLCLSFLFVFCFLFGFFFLVLVGVVIVVPCVLFGSVVRFLSLVVLVLLVISPCLLRGSCCGPASGVSLSSCLALAAFGWWGSFFLAVLVASRFSPLPSRLVGCRCWLPVGNHALTP